VFIDRAGRMSVIDRIAYATLLKVRRALIGEAVPIEKNMEDDVSETRLKRQRHEGISDSEVEGNIKQECATELIGVGKQRKKDSPSHMLWQQALQMNENEKYVERLASDRHEEQRNEVGSQRGGALNGDTNSGGDRMLKRLREVVRANWKMVEHSSGECEGVEHRAVRRVLDSYVFG